MHMEPHGTACRQGSGIGRTTKGSGIGRTTNGGDLKQQEQPAGPDDLEKTPAARSILPMPMTPGDR